MVRRLALVLATAVSGIVALAFLSTGATTQHAGKTVHCASVIVRMHTGPEGSAACEHRESGYAVVAGLAALLCLTFGTGARLSGPRTLPEVLASP